MARRATSILEAYTFQVEDENAQLTADLTAARAEIERLRGVLKSVEWINDEDNPGWKFCPSCDVWGRPGIDELTHIDTCALAAALKEE